MMSHQQPDAGQLCYLEASRVESPAGDLGGATVETRGDETLGILDGVLIDPTERRLRYFVVETPGWVRRRRYLLSADVPVRVEPDHHRLCIDAHSSDVELADEFHEETVRPFSTDDAITAMFSRTLEPSASHVS
jgi:hypothetical protein